MSFMVCGFVNGLGDLCRKLGLSGLGYCFLSCSNIRMRGRRVTREASITYLEEVQAPFL
jgi:hypothetical protein